MTVVIILLGIGAILLATEFFMPGLVLGTGGVILLFTAMGIAFWKFGAATGSVVALSALAMVGLILWAGFAVFPKTKLARSLSIAEEPAKNPTVIVDRGKAIGRECIARTMMAPSGFVELDGRQYDAQCQSGHAECGDKLHVVGVTSFQLIVSKSIKHI